ncbi:MAG TPA: hypothetical protein VGR35_01565 [Tepidisphaeraceae bacterium]|nr:hypothetical protein [Tepidisphaeraceae bacterium]
MHQRDELRYIALHLAYWHGERTTGATAAAYKRTVELLRAAGSPE